MNGDKTSYGWIIKNSDWDNRIDVGEEIVTTIIFEVSSDLPSTMTPEEYAQYFTENNIKVSGTSVGNNNRKGKIVKKGNAELTLKENELEIQNITVKKDTSYKVDDPNERQYIIDISNDTDKDFVEVRGNVFLGDNNKLLEASPSEITCQHGNNSTFVLPFWMQISAHQNATIYLIIYTEDDNFIPDIVMSATV